MVEIINLRIARKQAARDAKRQAGAEAAARHGQSKASQSLHRAQTDLAQRVLDGARRQDTGTQHADAAQSDKDQTAPSPKTP
jgi:hypothetical protein